MRSLLRRGSADPYGICSPEGANKRYRGGFTELATEIHVARLS